MELPIYLRKRRGFLELKQGSKWISWNPYHSKLSAYVLGKGKNWPFTKKSKILYLGSAEGNTVKFLSKMCINGEIIAVDISATAMAELIVLAEKETNIIPFLGDAHFPNKYQIYARKPDILYQDIAQSDQIEIFTRNYKFFNPKSGFLMIKSHSMSGKDKNIFDRVENSLNKEFDFIEKIDITKWAKGHKAYYIK
tara:strand:+ start:436 stop:1020 length:585 start_codon:yes stop_codon:yes gene_type:complete